MAGNLFGRNARPAQGGYGTPPREPPRDTPMGGYDDPRRPSPGYGVVPQRTAVGRQAPQGGGMVRQLRPAKVEDKNVADQYIYGNM
jgi:vesicle-fusing ATPase